MRHEQNINLNEKKIRNIRQGVGGGRSWRKCDGSRKEEFGERETRIGKMEITYCTRVDRNLEQKEGGINRIRRKACSGGS